MLERDLSLTKRETFIATSEPNYPTVPFLRGCVYAFSNSTKREVIEAQGGRCADCGKIGHLQCHHKVPQSLGGRDTKENAVALCRDDHLFWDNSTLRDGIMYPGKPLQEAPGGLIEDKNKFKRPIG